MSHPVEYRKADGTTVELPVLLVGQVLELAEEIRRGRIADIMAMAPEPEDRLLALRELDEQGGMAMEVLQWSYTAKGTVRVFEASLKLLDNGTKIDDMGLDLAEDRKVAMQLLGFAVAAEIRAKADEMDADSDPTSQKPSGT